MYKNQKSNKRVSSLRLNLIHSISPSIRMAVLIAFLSSLSTLSFSQNSLSKDSIDILADGKQKIEKAVSEIDRVLDQRDQRALSSVDTIYMKRASERLRIKMNLNMSGSEIIARGITDGKDYKSTLEAQNKITVSLAASYRGLSLSLALNPAKLAGKNKDIEINAIAYGNRLGADVVYQSSKTFRGTVDMGNIHYDMPTGIVSQEMLRMNAYYAFNARRFSYPAAFSQSWVQRKSCGSLLIGFSFAGTRLRIHRDATLNNSETRLDMMHLGLGVGYGYNFVIKKKWLLHLSTVPQLVVFNRSRLFVDDTKEKSPYRFPNIITVGRIAVVRHFERYFAGMSAVVNTMSVGDREELLLNQVKWRGRVFFGIKL